jgi:hypothetical protein
MPTTDRQRKARVEQRTRRTALTERSCVRDLVWPRLSLATRAPLLLLLLLLTALTDYTVALLGRSSCLCLCSVRLFVCSSCLNQSTNSHPLSLSLSLIHSLSRSLSLIPSSCCSSTHRLCSSISSMKQWTADDRC